MFILYSKAWNTFPFPQEQKPRAVNRSSLLCLSELFVYYIFVCSLLQPHWSSVEQKNFILSLDTLWENCTWIVTDQGKGFTFFFLVSLFSGHLFIFFSLPSYCLCSLYSHCTNYHLIYLKYLLFCSLHKNVYFIGLQMMAQWLRTLSAFTEEPSYLPSTKWWLTVITLVPGFWCTLLASSGMWCMCIINTGKTHINMRKKI